MIATLNDPRNPNDANVTLSRNDDLRRYSQELRHINIAARRKHIPIRQQNRKFVSRIGNRENVAVDKRDDITPFIEKLKESVATSRAIDKAHKHLSNEKKMKNSKENKKKKDFTENRFPHFYAHISTVHTVPRLGKFSFPKDHNTKKISKRTLLVKNFLSVL